MMRIALRALVLALVAALSAASPPALRAADLIPVIIGNIPSFTAAPLYIAIDKGYYTAAGLDVQLTSTGSPADQAAMLSTNRLQLVGGAVMAGFLHAFARQRRVL